MYLRIAKQGSVVTGTAAALILTLFASGCSSSPSPETSSIQIPETSAMVQVQDSHPPDQNVEQVVPSATPPAIPAIPSDPSSGLSNSGSGVSIAPVVAPTASSIVYSFDSSVRPHAPTGDNLGHSFSYDANGNMTGLATYSTYTQMRYNHFNKLDTVQSGSAVTKYLYDDSGNRIAKVVGGQVTERYFGSVEQRNGDTLHYYFHGSRRIAERNVSSGQLSFYHPDHLGSASVVTNNVGTELSRVDYYEFGATRQELGPRKEPFTYNDKRLDNETDFNDYGARMYAAKFMRFTSADTIVPNPTDPASFNRYSYVNNNPMKYVDPSGHAGEEFYSPKVPKGHELSFKWKFAEPKGFFGTVKPLTTIFEVEISSYSPGGTRTRLATAAGYFDPVDKDLCFNWDDTPASRGRKVYGTFHQEVLKKFPATETVTVPAFKDGNLRAWEVGGIGEVPKTRVMNNLGFEYFGNGSADDAFYAKLGTPAHDSFTKMSKDMGLTRYFRPTRSSGLAVAERLSGVAGGALAVLALGSIANEWMSASTGNDVAIAGMHTASFGIEFVPAASLLLGALSQTGYQPHADPGWWQGHPKEMQRFMNTHGYHPYSQGVNNFRERNPIPTFHGGP